MSGKVGLGLSVSWPLLMVPGVVNMKVGSWGEDKKEECIDPPAPELLEEACSPREGTQARRFLQLKP